MLRVPLGLICFLHAYSPTVKTARCRSYIYISFDHIPSIVCFTSIKPYQCIVYIWGRKQNNICKYRWSSILNKIILKKPFIIIAIRYYLLYITLHSCFNKSYSSYFNKINWYNPVSSPQTILVKVIVKLFLSCIVRLFDLSWQWRRKQIKGGGISVIFSHSQMTIIISFFLR